MTGGAIGSRIRTEDVRKDYRGRAVVQDVSIEVARGEVVGLLGPNGAGKTTTFNIVVGLTRPDGGRVFLDDEEITALPMYLRARSGISYLPQESSVFRRLSVEGNLRAVLETVRPGRARLRREMNRLIADFDLVTVRNQKASRISGGERRRLEIARALALNPGFILFDEPFAGIDPIAVRDIQAIVRQLRDNGIGILITDHNVQETLRITDRAYIINDGRILRTGTPESLSADETVRQIYLGSGFTL